MGNVIAGIREYTEVNEDINSLFLSNNKVTVTDVNGQRYLGCALTDGKTLEIEGTAGNDLAFCLSGGKIVLDGKPKDVFQQSDVLLREGLAVPATTALLQALKSDGMDVPTDALAVNDCADAIAAALQS